jgi:hypothetical protein
LEKLKLLIHQRKLTLRKQEALAKIQIAEEAAKKKLEEKKTKENISNISEMLRKI